MSETTDQTAEDTQETGARTLGEQLAALIDGLGGKTNKADLKAQAERLRDDLVTSGAATILVVRDVPDQPSVTTNVALDGTVG